MDTTTSPARRRATRELPRQADRAGWSVARSPSCTQPPSVIAPPERLCVGPLRIGQAVRVAWTNEVAALAVAALAIYFIRDASALAREERRLLRFGDRYERSRIWSYRLLGAFLLVFAVVLAISGVT